MPRLIVGILILSLCLIFGASKTQEAQATNSGNHTKKIDDGCTCCDCKGRIEDLSNEILQLKIRLDAVESIQPIKVEVKPGDTVKVTPEKPKFEPAIEPSTCYTDSNGNTVCPKQQRVQQYQVPTYQGPVRRLFRR